MLSIRSKYAEVLREMAALAEANVNEANAELKKADDAVERCTQSLEGLKDARKSAKAQFVKDGKSLTRIGRSGGIVNNDAVDDISQNIQEFLSADENLPKAEEALENALREQKDASYVLMNAMEEKKAIFLFLSK